MTCMVAQVLQFHIYIHTLTYIYVISYMTYLIASIFKLKNKKSSAILHVEKLFIAFLTKIAHVSTYTL